MRNLSICLYWLLAVSLIFVIYRYKHPFSFKPSFAEIHFDSNADRQLKLSWEFPNGNSKTNFKYFSTKQTESNARIPLPQRKLKSIRIESDSNSELGITKVDIHEITDGEMPGEPLLPFKKINTDRPSKVIATINTSSNQKIIQISDNNLPSGYKSEELIVYQIAASIFIVSFAFSILILVLRELSNYDRKTLYWSMSYFLILFGYLLTWNLQQWPGFPTIDTYDQLNQKVILTFTNWNPFIHSIFLNGMVDLFGSLGSISIVHSLLIAMIGAWIFSVVRFAGVNKLILYLFALFLLLSPVVSIYTLQPWRDILFSILTIYYFFLLFKDYALYRYKKFKNNWTTIQLASFSFVLFVVSIVRHNGLPFLVMIPALFFIAGQFNKRQLATALCLSILNYFIFISVIGGSLNVHKNTNYQEIRYSLFVNSIGAVVSANKNNNAKITEDELTSIDRVISIEELKKNYNPGSVVPLVPLKKQVDETVFNEFQRAALKVIFNNLDIVIKSKIKLFISGLGFDTWGWASGLGQPFGQEKFIPVGRYSDNLSDLERAPKILFLQDLQSYILQNVYHGPGIFDKWLLWFSAVIPAVVSLIVLMFYKRLPCLALSTTIVVSQNIFIASTSLATDFRYFYYLYIYGLVVIPIIFTELKLKKAL